MGDDGLPPNLPNRSSGMSCFQVAAGCWLSRDCEDLVAKTNLPGSLRELCLGASLPF